jgi:WD40 repeat protein
MCHGHCIQSEYQIIKFFFDIGIHHLINSTLVSASSDGSVRVFSMNRHGNIGLSAIFIHPCFVYTAAFHPDFSQNHIIASGGSDNSIRIWKFYPSGTLRSDGRPQKPFMEESTPVNICVGHKAPVNSIVFDEEGKKFYSGDSRGIVRIWSANGNGNKNSGSEGNYDCVKVLPVSDVSDQILYFCNRPIDFILLPCIECWYPKLTHAPIWPTNPYIPGGQFFKVYGH